jgi:alpha-tubulin suppressor-like RCC1 family protein
LTNPRLYSNPRIGVLKNGEKMEIKNVYRGRALRIAAGILVMVLLLTGGAGAKGVDVVAIAPATATQPALSVTVTPSTLTAGTTTLVTFTVTSKMGAVVSGAAVTLTGAASGSGTTNANGAVTLTVNTANAGTITATASKTGFISGSTTITATVPAVAVYMPVYISAIAPAATEVWAWGSNSNGQLGDGTTTQSLSPVKVSGLTGTITAIAAGYDHTVALKNDGTVWAWGNNVLDPACVGTFGWQCAGDGAHPQSSSAVRVSWTTGIFTPVSSLTGVKAIAVGQVHTVVLKNDGTVWVWGDNNAGQLGDGLTYPMFGGAGYPVSSSSPVQVSGLTGITAIAAGNYHTVALMNNGTVWAWGSNSYGQLGDGTTTNRFTPVKISGLTGITAIAAGETHTVALKNDGTVWAWGDNGYGQLGDGTFTSQRLSPVQVSGLTGITAIAAGGIDTVALKNDGTVWAWGDRVMSPVQVSGLTGITAIAAGGTETGGTHAVALKNDGTVWAWGYNDYGQLGDNTTIGKKSPVQVSGLTNVKAIAAGGYHTVALKGSPPTLSVSTIPDTTAGTPASVTFTVTGAGSPVSGATVTLIGAASGNGTTDASGKVNITVNATGAGTITATAGKTGFTDGSTTITATAPATTATTPTVTPAITPPTGSATPTIVTLQGKLTDSAGNPVQTGSMNITITDSSGVQVWQETFNDVIDNGVFNIPLGAIHELRLLSGSIYNMKVAIDTKSKTFSTVDVTFGENLLEGDVIKFKA